MATLYDILQVSPQADPAVIEAAYRSLVAKYEPQTATSHEATQQLRSLKEAYQVLSDPARRAEYDRVLQGYTPPAPRTPESAFAPTQRVPAVDQVVSAPAPVKRKGTPMWVLAILGLCAIVALGGLCLGGLAIAAGGAGLAFLAPIRSQVVVVATSEAKTPTPTPATIIPLPVESDTPASVVPPPVESDTPIPTEAATATPTAAANNPSGGGEWITSVTMARDTQGGNVEPVNPTTTFPTDAIFHAVVRTQDAPANTKFDATWFAVDVGNAAAPNTKIDSSELTTEGTRNLDFTLKPKTTWPPGSYRVEIYVNDQLAKTVDFSVQ